MVFPDRFITSATMSYSVALIRQLETVDPALRQVLLAILDEVEQHRAVTVTRDDFADLRAAVAGLAEAQQRTEARMGRLAEAQQRTEARMEQLADAQQRTEASMGQLSEAQQRTEASMEGLAGRMDALADAQQRTEARMGQLAEAQQRTEASVERLAGRMDALAEAQQRTEASVERLAGRIDALTEAQQRTEAAMEQLALAQAETQQELSVLSRAEADTRRQLGGLARSTAYALENEAYRQLPKLLEGRGIKVSDRFVRTTLEGEEINFLAHAERDGQPVVIVGESVLRLEDTNKLAQLHAHEALARTAYGLATVPLLVTHFARPNIREKLEARGVVVVESFEWL
jgi:chromosome segregation ATPase